MFFFTLKGQVARGKIDVVKDSPTFIENTLSDKGPRL